MTGPSTLTTFLGINIDSVGMELSLPMGKVDKLRDLTTTILDRGHSTKNELECLEGLVSYCLYVVRGGRTFSRRIFGLSASHLRGLGPGWGKTGFMTYGLQMQFPQSLPAVATSNLLLPSPCPGPLRYMCYCPLWWGYNGGPPLHQRQVELYYG